MKQPLIVIAGATAVGKTSLSIELAKKINGEIISADSMQVYKYMDIGTAKPTKDEMQGIPHHLIDILLPDETCSVAYYQEKCKECINKISETKIPIIVGGTGFYINAVINDNDFSETENDYEYRKELFDLAQDKGNEFIHEMLKKSDPESAEKIHYNNVKRVVRALEYFKQTGQKISDHNRQQKLQHQLSSKYNLLFVILNADREKLYKKINLRADKMISDGLLNEVENLINMGYNKDLVSMRGLGYREIAEYFEGKLTLDEATEALKQNTRHYAKRQLTWFKNQCDGIWQDTDKYSQPEIMNQIISLASEKGIL